MQYISDLHIHSKYSRATSKDLTLPNIDKWCKIKGVDIIATGDFTHPAWFKAISEQLEPAEDGLYRLKPKYCSTISKTKTVWYDASRPVKFLLSTEVSLIYTKNNKCRRLHILIFAPSIETARKINVHLEKIGNIHSDGRPILGLDAEELTKIILDKSKKCMVIPAHAWTPWFAVFGSKSGFNSLEECFGSMTKYIYAIETGLSSDPAMNWQLSALDNIALISNSDAHSPSNIAREANIFNFKKLNYDEIYNTIKNKDKNKFIKTIEFFPEEGKYHFDGHRDCNISFSPKETRKHNGICPICKKSLTVGVAYRVSSLADKPAFQESDTVRLINKERLGTNNSPQEKNSHIPFISLVGLLKIIAEAKAVNGTNSKTVQNEYQNLIKNFGAELEILMNTDIEDFKNKKIDDNIIEGIKRVRERRLNIKPGYDGVYGDIKIFEDGEIKKKKQTPLL
ncbi:MAG: endonuclease Q family protein [bacterium]